MGDNDWGRIGGLTAMVASNDTHRDRPAGVGASWMKEQSEHSSLPVCKLELGSEVGLSSVFGMVSQL